MAVMLEIQQPARALQRDGMRDSFSSTIHRPYHPA